MVGWPHEGPVQLLPSPRTLWIDLGAIFVPTLLLTAAAVGLGLDLSLSSFSLAALLIATICVPAVRRRWPLFVRCSAVFILTTIIAVMGFIQNTKLELSRLRPHQVKELQGRHTFQPPFGSDRRCRGCNSFSSSAAGSAFLVATPYFVLRRRSPKVELGFLAVVSPGAQPPVTRAWSRGCTGSAMWCGPRPSCWPPRVPCPTSA